jgi:peptidoglycan/LPS O-acetylase OafA/YrhL
MTPSPDRPPIPALTGLRAVAAWAIVLKHASLSILVFADQNQIKLIFHQFALFGMTLFFMLSGFVIHYNYGHKLAVFTWSGLRGFLTARIARLYPLFLLLLVFDLVCSNVFATATAKQMPVLFAFLPFHLTMTQSWFLIERKGLFVSHPYAYTDIAWSISTEMGLYLLYLAVPFWLTRLTRPLPLAALTFAVVAAATLGIREVVVNEPAVNVWIESTLGWRRELYPANWLWYMSPYGRFPEFLAGAMLAQLHLVMRGRRPWQFGNQCTFVLTMSFLILMSAKLIPQSMENLGVIQHYIVSFPFIPLVAWMIFASCHQEGILTRALSRPFPLALGEASYSTYMWHLVLISSLALPYPLPGTAQSLVIMVARMTALIVLIALLSRFSYKNFEIPMQRKMLAWLS